MVHDHAELALKETRPLCFLLRPVGLQKCSIYAKDWSYQSLSLLRVLHVTGPVQHCSRSQCTIFIIAAHHGSTACSLFLELLATALKTRFRNGMMVVVVFAVGTTAVQRITKRTDIRGISVAILQTKFLPPQPYS